jgi:DNA-binding transcriptional LysR family regulator
VHVDLNLLTGLDALLEQRSVQDAAAQLHLSPPAVSRTLGRLRAATGDALLVRNGREMVPTPHALALRDEVHELVQRAAAILEPARELDLAHLERTFTVRANDILLAAFAPGLLQVITRDAGGVALRLLGENPEDDKNLSRGEVDLDAGSLPDRSASIASHVVGTDEMALVVRAGHPLAAAALTLEAFADATHIVVSRRGRLHGPVDAILEARGLHRRVAAALPSFAAALAILESSDTVCVLPRRLGVPASRPLVPLALPFPLRSVPAVLTWHRRHDTDPAHRWLRETIASILAARLTAPAELFRACYPGSSARSPGPPGRRRWRAATRRRPGWG